MSDFRRFVSYVYEYQNNNKMGNKGFIKVEARNGTCQLSFNLKGLCLDGNCDCHLYAFSRGDSLLIGSSLGEYPVHGGILNHNIRVPQEAIGSEKFSLSKLAGILITDSNQTIYATQWDDAPLDFTGFPNISSDNSEEVPDRTAPLEKEPKEPVLQNENPQATDSKDKMPLESLPEETVSGEDTVQEEINVENRKEEDDLQATSAETAAWNPFPDGDIIDCIKITPKDISRLSREDWHLSNNRFVSYGYQNFGHLIIGQLAATGQTILGVPGTYHQQECFMANMFGFPNFKRCRKTPSRPHCFGYWYRSIQPTNLNQRNCSS